MRDDSVWLHNATVAVNKIKTALENNQLALQLQQEWQFVCEITKNNLVTDEILKEHDKRYTSYQSIWRRFIA